MSAFGNYEQDEIVDSIINYINYKKEKEQSVQINEIMKEVMEAVGYAIQGGIWKIENEK